ncbi:hypothetical protein [Paenibacillus apis]|uniref:Uncharacterized protein n=1 Tax=Paenibacillus apis TaxID=1792174 RepID=A0A919XYI7_9BACL|nr:hypothetical protein [Paenibacillus apis]GIO41372.1 hypothetical protein J41TS4_11300 [Paenibacillus apis]
MEVRTRKRIAPPSTDQMILGLREVLEEIADREQSLEPGKLQLEK